MADTKTQPTQASVQAYIDARGNEAQRADCAQLGAMMQRVTGQPAVMWGPSIVGFGAYRYPLAGGREGTSCLTGFAIRQSDLVVYLVAESPAQDALRARLGKHRMGKSCLYFKRLADLDATVLEQLVAGSVAELRRRHP